MLTPIEMMQRGLALLGSGLAGDQAGLEALTEDLSRADLRALVEGASLVLGAELLRCPDEETAAALVSERILQLALKDGRAAR